MMLRMFMIGLLLMTNLKADFYTTATSQVGKTYTWGAPSCKNETGCKSYDCSSLIQWVYRQEGVNIPRTNKTMCKSNLLKQVSVDDLQIGDIMMWGVRNGYPNHSTIYIGNGMHVSAEHTDYGVVTIPLWTNTRLGKWRDGYYVTHYKTTDLNRVLRYKQGE